MAIFLWSSLQQRTHAMYRKQIQFYLFMPSGRSFLSLALSVQIFSFILDARGDGKASINCKTLWSQSPHSKRQQHWAYNGILFSYFEKYQNLCRMRLSCKIKLEKWNGGFSIWMLSTSIRRINFLWMILIAYNLK